MRTSLRFAATITSLFLLLLAGPAAAATIALADTGSVSLVTDAGTSVGALTVPLGGGVDGVASDTTTGSIYASIFDLLAPGADRNLVVAHAGTTLLVPTSIALDQQSGNAFAVHNGVVAVGVGNSVSLHDANGGAAGSITLPFGAGVNGLAYDAVSGALYARLFDPLGGSGTNTAVATPGDSSFTVLGYSVGSHFAVHDGVLASNGNLLDAASGAFQRSISSPLGTAVNDVAFDPTTGDLYALISSFGGGGGGALAVARAGDTSFSSLGVNTWNGLAVVVPEPNTAWLIAFGLALVAARGTDS